MAPEMSGGVQKSYDGSHGTMYTFICTLEDGTTGQVSSKSAAPHRFGPGDEVEYTYTPASNPKHTGKLKVEKPKDEGHSAPTNGEAPRSSGWSPTKESSVMIQGLLKSVIESGVKSDHWEQAVGKALGIHDKLLAARVPAQAPTPSPQPVAKLQPAQVASVINDESDLPF
jgi:hypothetical protein